MWDLSILGIDFYHLINWFIIYSFFGWVWETCYVSIKSGKYVNRGFINGPFCTIYGCGAVSVYVILRPVSGNLLWLYIGGVVVATALEYVTAVLMETIFHTSWWDYSENKFNFQGRICLGASLGWGFFTVLLFKVLHPIVEYIVALYPVFVGEIGVCVIGIGYVVDFAFSAAAAFRIQGTIGETSAIAILIGAAILLVYKVIDLKIPLTYIGSFAVFVILYMLGTGKGFDVNYLFSHIFGGGLMLGAWFMATDYVTTPITPRGQYVYGVCLGVLTAIFRLFGGSAEGVSYAIIFCNLLVPMIERVTRHPAFGKGGKKA